MDTAADVGYSKLLIGTREAAYKTLKKGIQVQLASCGNKFRTYTYAENACWNKERYMRDALMSETEGRERSSRNEQSRYCKRA
jgi:hypothetical protein